MSEQNLRLGHDVIVDAVDDSVSKPGRPGALRHRERVHTSSSYIS